jgi:hypothetical protein
MSFCHHREWNRRDVDALVTRGLAPRRHSALREHLRGCDECRSYYEEARRVEDALYPAAALSVAALDRICELVVVPPRRRRVWPWALLPALAASAALVLLLVPRAGDEELATRGADVAPARGVALQAFGIDDSGVPRRLHDGDELAQGTRVQLAYSNGGWGFGAVVGVDSEWRVHTYHESAALLAGAADEPFGGAWRIVTHPGPLRLYAVFSDTPLDDEALAAAVWRLRDASRTLEQAVELPGVGGAQDSLLLRVSQ